MHFSTFILKINETKQKSCLLFKLPCRFNSYFRLYRVGLIRTLDYLIQTSKQTKSFQMKISS